MNKKIILISFLVLALSSVLYAGFSLGKINVVKNKVEEVDKDVQNIITEREEAAKWEVAEDEWSVVSNEFVIVGKGNGQYRMWPRLRETAATNNNEKLEWKTSKTAGQPVWNNTTKIYTYPTGETSRDYPVFKWAEELVYGGYSDWRLPDKSELEQLYDFGSTYIGTIAETDHWSDDEANLTDAWTWRFEDGWSRYIQKTTKFFVRAVRDGSY